MKQFATGAIVVLSLLSANIASAQAYYPSTSCIAISRDLVVGSRGSDVISLQRFLVAQNFPGGGPWMVTGYYGAATRAAVRIYQQQHGLPQSGMADAQTRASIAGCGATNYVNSYPYTYNYPTTYPTPAYPTYPTYPSYPSYPYQYGTPTLTSFSTQTAAIGTQITVYGTGFDLTNNTVYVAGTSIPNVSSYNGTALTFTVPFVSSGTAQVYVANARGTSNPLTLTLTNYNGCTYPYNTGSCGCAYNSSCGNNGPLSVSYLSPNSGAVGQSVTVFGSGFSATNNSVRFGNGVIANISSNDGRTLTFTVPSTLTGFGSQAVTLGTYYVAVTNALGQTSNSLPYTVTSLGSSGIPSVQTINGPTTIAVGVTGTWTVTINNPASTNLTVAVNWGDTGVFGAQSSAPQYVLLQGQTTLSFQHAYLQTGTYTIVFTATNAQGQQNQASMSVTVIGSNASQTSLNSISPTSGRVGTQVSLAGSGFTSDNTVRFGVGGTQHVFAQNGNTIYYTIPSYVSPCDVNAPGTYCAAYAQQVTPGAYQIFVTNGNGASNQLTFTVTQ